MNIIEKINSETELQSHIAETILLYNKYNKEPINPIQEEYYRKIMTVSNALGTSYKCGNSYIYLTSEENGWSICSVNLKDNLIEDAYFVAKLVMDKYVLSYIPLGQYIGGFMPFLKPISIIKWRDERSKVIKIINKFDLEELIKYIEKSNV